MDFDHAPVRKSFGWPISIQNPDSSNANNFSSFAITGNTSFSMEVGFTSIRFKIDGLKIYIPKRDEKRSGNLNIIVIDSTLHSISLEFPFKHTRIDFITNKLLWFLDKVLNTSVFIIQNNAVFGGLFDLSNDNRTLLAMISMECF